MADTGDEMRTLVFDECRDKMRKAVAHLQEEFGGIRTGRATPGLVDKIKVDAYGSEVPLQQLAGISVPEPRLLVISPYDKGSMKAIEKAIQASDLGVNPSNDGANIRITFPELTTDRRKELVKVVKKMAEDGRVAVRNVRRDVMHHLKELVHNGEVGDDDERRAEEQAQKLTDQHTKTIDDLLKHKESEILEV
jgi:ribosome recycling factor